MDTGENNLWQAAKRALFDEQLAEIRAMAEESFRSLGVPIGNLMLGHCTRCGAPIGYGERVYRTRDCTRDCGGE